MGKKKILIAFIVLAFLPALYFFGKERWLEEPTALDSNVYSLYNQGRVDHFGQNYDAASDKWGASLVHQQTDEKTTRWSLFNLGNNAFNQSVEAEKKQDLGLAIEKMQRSILRFKDLLARLDDSENLLYKDTVHNLALSRIRLKYLIEKNKQDKKNKDKQKQPYQLLLEILKDEETLKMLSLQLKDAEIDLERKKQIRSRISDLQKRNAEKTSTLLNLSSKQTPGKTLN